MLQQLQQLTQDNYDTIGYYVITVGNAALGLAKTALDVSTPILQDFFAATQ